jgi:hypothetical protein
MAGCSRQGWGVNKKTNKTIGNPGFMTDAPEKDSELDFGKTPNIEINDPDVVEQTSIKDGSEVVAALL